MKKNIFAKWMTLTLLVVSVCVISCDKDDDEIQYGASVNAVSNLLDMSIYETPDAFGFQSYTLGIVFQSAKAGRITHLGALMGKGTFTVTLWDSTTQTLLRSVQVTITDSTEMTFVDISDINITANKSYIVAVNNTQEGTTNFRNYWLYSIDMMADNLPHTLGDITFLAEIEKQTSDPESLFPPSHWGKDYIAGVPLFKFEPQL
jgi:hypothetical protein